MKTITVMFTACCGWPTCGTIDALKKSKDYDFRVVGVDCNPNPAAYNYVDALYKVPGCKDPEYCSSLLEICAKEKVDVIMPLISDEIDILNANIAKFEENGIKLALTKNHDGLDIANNKQKLQMFLESKGIDIMPKTIPLRKDNVGEALSELGYPDKPVCLKRMDGCGAAGFSIVDDKMAMKSVFARSRAFRGKHYISKEQIMKAIDNVGDDFMLQEFEPGKEFGVLCLVDNGETIYSVTHENEVMEFATTVRCSLQNNEKANEIVKEINKLLKLDGNIGYDFIRTGAGDIKLLEINPRISATVSLAAKGGLNLIEYGVLHALGRDFPKDIVPMYGLRLTRNYGTLYEMEGEPFGR